jgi:sugar/nucleoside kinase (ribokinase family)
MTALDLFSIGSWTLFDHLLRLPRLPREGETLALDMPIEELDATYFGDCSANIAAAAGKLGLAVGLGMVVGEDFDSSGYRQHLTGLGVDLEGVDVRGGSRSGHSYNVFDYENNGYCISHLGVAAAQDDWQPPLTQIARARAVVVSEMFSPYTVSAIEHARQQGKMTAINGMVGSQPALARRFLAAADMLFLNRNEANDLQTALNVPDVAGLLETGPSLIVVTEGIKGSRWYSATGTTLVTAVPAERFADSTGAGDAFTAGALFGLLSGLETEEAGRCAAITSSFVVEAWGCQTNLPGPDDLRARYREHFAKEPPW